MKSVRRAALLALTLTPGCVASSTASLATPVQKVVELLQGMVEKGKAAKQAEEVDFAKYKRFCEDTSSQKSNAISKANERIELLKADIQKASSDADRLGKEIAAHDEDISVWNGDLEAATKVRGIEQADYEATHEDYSESIDALGRAVLVLKAAPGKLAQAELIQLQAIQTLARVPVDAKMAVAAFIAEGGKRQPLGVVAPPKAHGYEGHSHGIVEMLESLQDKFVQERTNLEKEETERKQGFEMLAQDLRNQIAEASRIREEKATEKAKKLQSKANSEGSLVDTSTTRDADSEYLSDLVATCEQKATDFKSRQELRAEELVAVGKAIDILSGESVAGSASKHLPALLQVHNRRSLAHLRSDQASATRTLLGAFLRSKAESLSSRILSLLADRVTADPFQKVKKMIQDLLTKLQQEANEEAEHKGWCDTELKTNEKTRNAKTDAVETLHAEIDLLQSSIAKITADLAALEKAVTELDGSLAEASSLRAAEKAKNEETIADAQAAQASVASALSVLQEFFAKAGQATAFLQQRREGRQGLHAAEALGDEPYQGLSAEGGGVVSMIEVVQSDFARLESETKNAEAASQKEFESLTNASSADKAAKLSDIEHLTAKKQDQSQALAERIADLEGTQRELTAANAYFDKLKPSCVDSGVSYEDRVARREAELDSLQQALRILNGE